MGLRSSQRSAALLTGVCLTAGLIATPAAAQPTSNATESAPGAQAHQVQAAARMKPGRIVIKVKGQRLGVKPRIVVKGAGGKARGVKKSVRVAKSKTLRGLKPGRYRITAGNITRGGQTSTAAIKPRTVKLTRKRGAAVTVRYRLRPAEPTPTPTPPPTNPPGDRTFTALSAGTEHTCGLDNTGAAWCWGSDEFGQVGDGYDDQGNTEFSPVAVVGGHNFTAITAGSAHTCALDTTGAAWCWGDDKAGQVGDGNDEQDREFGPVAVAGGHRFTAIAGQGSEHICALDTTGAAWCWGDNHFGQLGDDDPTFATERFLPVAVVGGHTFTTISVGGFHTCGLDTTGAAWCWGTDSSGEVGDGNDDQEAEPRPVAVAGGRSFTAISAGGFHTCALDISRTAWCWGSDAYAQIGDGDDDQGKEFAPVAVAGGRSFTAITAGTLHTCGLDTTGAAWCWGVTFDGFAIHSVEYAPAAVAGGRSFRSITDGGRHTCALDATGAAWCWGTDDYGQVGDGEGAQTRFAPVAVATGPLFRKP